MKYIKDESISYGDVTIQTQYSDLDSRSEVNLETGPYNYPIIGSPMYHLDTIEMYNFFTKNKIPFVLHRYFSDVTSQINRIKALTNDMVYYDSLYMFVSVGFDEKWIGKLILNGVKSFCVDMANGNSKQAVDTVSFIKEYCPDATIMAGNIETYDGFKRLYDAGARLFRIGIGSGSICSTHINTGYGLPILSAINEIKTRIDNTFDDVSLIADGGIRTAGDVAKALAFGADFVMCGKLFAATTAARGPFFDSSGAKYKLYNEDIRKWIKQDNGEDDSPVYAEYAGMASTLMREMAGGSQKTNVSEEGKAGLIECVGSVENMISKMVQNLKAVVAYSGCRNISEFKEECIIRRVSSAGKFEKQVHLDTVYK